LGENDVCLFYGEYTARAGFATPTNDLILNLKKEPSRRNRPEWKWKVWAINRCVEILKDALDASKLSDFIAVPAPPSKRPGHPDYDDRMVQVVRTFCDGTPLQAIELLVTRADREPAHATDAPRDAIALAESIVINPECTKPPGKAVLLFDDVLTTGCTFKACESVLQSAYPGVKVVGVFIARRAIPRSASGG
jgi:predicted amidophosphoribosyltransferase